jgi:hypothetical protein
LKGGSFLKAFTYNLALGTNDRNNEFGSFWTVFEIIFLKSSVLASLGV